ncbi:hypothetical protein BDZ91DRAFT_713974 [Kalaharituber pfeilii]|nr:hypothetical protein BDZ91DRAFT_713974 [Kalaharituber pfeilii]
MVKQMSAVLYSIFLDFFCYLLSFVWCFGVEIHVSNNMLFFPFLSFPSQVTPADRMHV